jgi:hypothetical protein
MKCSRGGYRLQAIGKRRIFLAQAMSDFNAKVQFTATSGATKKLQTQGG